jgi:hypothetical protein
MSRRRRPSETNITLRVDADVLLWARVRAGFARTSVNALVRHFLWEYAGVPEAFLEGEQWWSNERKAVETFRQLMDPAGAGTRAREAGEERAWAKAGRDPP